MADKPAAKDAPAAATPADEEAAGAAPRKPSAIMTIVKAIAFVSILVIVQVVGASMFIPAAEDTAKLAKRYVAAGTGEAAAAASHESEGHGEEHAGADTVEVDMGSFN